MCLWGTGPKMTHTSKCNSCLGIGSKNALTLGVAFHLPSLFSAWFTEIEKKNTSGKMNVLTYASGMTMYNLSAILKL